MLPSKVVRQGWGNVVVMQCCVHQVDTYDISCVIFMVSTLYVFHSSISSTCTLLHDLVISYDILCHTVFYTHSSSIKTKAAHSILTLFPPTITVDHGAKGVWVENSGVF